MPRVTVYIDGFNLYFGLKSKCWKKYYWLDLVSLSKSLMKTDQRLITVNYFTSRLRLNGRNHADMERQNDYLDALNTLPDLEIHYGHYLQKPRRCNFCGTQWTDYEEKMTDVNIAAQLITDAFEDKFDTALLISADSDLVAPVKTVLTRFKGKKIIVAQPPGRNSVNLCKSATASFTISETKIRQNQLPMAVTTPNGFEIQKPPRWS